MFPIHGFVREVLSLQKFFYVVGLRITGYTSHVLNMNALFCLYLYLIMVVKYKLFKSKVNFCQWILISKTRDCSIYMDASLSFQN